MREPLIFSGGYFCDALPSERRVVLYPGSHLSTDTRARIELPPGEGTWPSLHYPRCTDVGGFRFAAAAHSAVNTVWEWIDDREIWIPHEGITPPIYDQHGHLHLERVLLPNGEFSAYGWSYVADDGRLVSVQETWLPDQYNLSNWIERGPFHFGTDHDTGGVWIAQRTTGARRRLDDGDCTNIHVERAATAYAISYFKKNVGSCIWYCTESEILALFETDEEPDHTDPGPTPTVRPIARKVWMSPFYSFSERYGDSSLAAHPGNAICLVGDERDASVLHRELDHVRPLGQPLVVSAMQDRPADVHLNTTIAWWVSGADSAALADHVSQALDFPEKPVIAYLDRGTAADWPSVRPRWVTDRVWPSLQAYRGPQESLTAFNARMIEMLDRVNGYGRPLALTPRFDDTNGLAPVSNILECMPLYEQWMHDYFIVVWMPFADRRGHGISFYPALRAWAMAFLGANPTRPNRFDYWSSADVSITDVLKNKLMQTTELINLSQPEKGYLLELIKEENGPVDPPDVDPPVDPPVEDGKMMLPEDVYATYVACVKRFPHSGTDDDRREAQKKAIQTIRARHGSRYIWKTEHSNLSSPAKDAMGRVPGSAPIVHGERTQMYIWDMINGTTRLPNDRGWSEVIREAYALVVEPKDWLLT